MNWRASCRAALDLKNRKLRDGDVIELREPVTFTDGATSTVFTVRKVKHRRRTRTELHIEGQASAYQITGLMKLAWKKRPKAPPTGTFFGGA